MCVGVAAAAAAAAQLQRTSFVLVRQSSFVFRCCSLAGWFIRSYVVFACSFIRVVGVTAFAYAAAALAATTTGEGSGLRMHGHAQSTMHESRNTTNARNTREMQI